MANGQQKAQQNAAAFQAWSATQSEDDFKQIIFQGQLNRGEIAKAVGCGKSALSQNPELRKHPKIAGRQSEGKKRSPPTINSPGQSQYR